jgi:nitric oxide reductase NorQ protein
VPEKWDIDDITIGAVMETTFWANAVEDSPFRYRATHLDGRRAPKVVLCDDPRLRPGVPCLVKIAAVRKPKRSDRGAIEVEFVRTLDFKLEGVYLDPLVSRKLQVLLESGMNILLDGPQGCGKTVLAQTISESLGMEFVFFNCGAVVEATDFLATVQVRASETGQPVMDFIKTEFLQALEEAGGHTKRRYLIFLDEFNRCQENARNALMPALDASRRVFNPIENKFLEIPDNVQFIAAVNRGSEFSGTFGIDAAQLDRFAPLQMDYLPPKEEVKLLRKRHPELGATLPQIVKIADTIRKSPEIAGGLSVRATDEACIYLKHPLFEKDRHRLLPEILKSSFCGRFPGRWDDVTTDAGAVWAIVESMVVGKKKNKGTT